MVTMDKPCLETPADSLRIGISIRPTGRNVPRWPPATIRLAVLWAIAAAALTAVVVLALEWSPTPLLFRATVLTAGCLILWLLELVPLYATTLLLWVAMVTLLGPLEPKAFALGRVTSVLGSPVLLLFFGGFVLSVAAEKYRIDAVIAQSMVRLSNGRRARLLLTVMFGTAALSMWMSNIAAAAMMMAALKPLLRQDDSPRFHKALFLGVAFAADFGGMGTPIGTGSNLIAMQALADRWPMNFVQWMAFGVPAMLVMVSLSYAFLRVRYAVTGGLGLPPVTAEKLSPAGKNVVGIAGVTAVLWLLEPWHGINSAIIGLLSAFIFFSSGLLKAADLSKVQWDTLLLVAGGLSLGDVFANTGLADQVAMAVQTLNWPPVLLLMTLGIATALLGAFSSNTAATALMVPIALDTFGHAHVAVVIALAASMGVPFVISTPPNAMACHDGTVKGTDLFIPGLFLMLAGCGALVLAEWIFRLP